MVDFNYLKLLVSLKNKPSIPSNMGPPKSLTLNATVFALGFTQPFTNKLFKQFIKAYLKTQTSALV